MIKFFITGGTIDCEEIKEDNSYIFDRTYLKEMLEQGKCLLNIDPEILMMKDSLYMTDEDREKILLNCQKCKEKQIVITHGTDTMSETAKFLGGHIKNKTIVLVGAMIPYNQKQSDALFNLGCAVSAVQALENGVYVTMNGKIFPWNDVRKNKSLGLFETIN